MFHHHVEAIERALQRHSLPVSALRVATRHGSEHRGTLTISVSFPNGYRLEVSEVVDTRLPGHDKRLAHSYWVLREDGQPVVAWDRDSAKPEYLRDHQHPIGSVGERIPETVTFEAALRRVWDLA